MEKKFKKILATGIHYLFSGLLVLGVLGLIGSVVVFVLTLALGAPIVGFYPLSGFFSVLLAYFGFRTWIWAINNKD